MFIAMVVNAAVFAALDPSLNNPSKELVTELTALRNSNWDASLASFDATTASSSSVSNPILSW